MVSGSGGAKKQSLRGGIVLGPDWHILAFAVIGIKDVHHVLSPAEEAVDVGFPFNPRRSPSAGFEII